MTVQENITCPFATTDAQGVESPPSEHKVKMDPHPDSTRVFCEADEPVDDDADFRWTEC